MENRTIKLTYKEKNITLIPTAHVSKESANFVESIIDEIKPDAICIELDKDRYNTMTEPEKYRNTDIIKIIKEKKVAILLVNLILANYQKKIATNLDSKSGMEMLIGINKAKELNSELVLADRSVQTTFKRIWANLNGKDKFKLITTIISTLFDNEQISEEDIAKLQQEDMLTSALNEVSKEFPHITEVLVDERDKYLAYKIKNASGNNIVAILGAAHTVNIPKYINEEYEINQYDVVPQKTTLQKLKGWILPIIIMAIILSSFKLDSSIGLQSIKGWILINGTLSAIGSLLAAAHPLAIITAFLAAPITSLNPLLAAGWFAGLAQAYLVKPTVADFDSLSEDCNSIKGFWKNKVSRILLIVIFANLGSTLGTFISSIDVIKNLLSLL